MTLDDEDVELLEGPESAPESVVQRVSRMPTRRVVSWPVIGTVARKKSRSPAWSLAVHVTMALALACGVALGIVALDGEAATSAHMTPPPAMRVGSVHVIDEGFDKVLSAPPEVASPLPPAPAPASHKSAANVHRGRVHPGHRQGRATRH